MTNLWRTSLQRARRTGTIIAVSLVWSALSGVVEEGIKGVGVDVGVVEVEEDVEAESVVGSGVVDVEVDAERALVTGEGMGDLLVGLRGLGFADANANISS